MTNWVGAAPSGNSISGLVVTRFTVAAGRLRAAVFEPVT